MRKEQFQAPRPKMQAPRRRKPVALASRRSLKPAILFSVLRNFLQPLIAILAGNVIYFLLLWPYLPPQAHHGIDRLDLGLLVDFWICLACFAVVKLLWSKKKRP
jgi:hypothetical protein